MCELIMHRFIFVGMAVDGRDGTGTDMNLKPVPVVYAILVDSKRSCTTILTMSLKYEFHRTRR